MVGGIIAVKEFLKDHIRNRHYYLKMAYRSIKLREFSEMHTFCRYAEREQKIIEDIIPNHQNV